MLSIFMGVYPQVNAQSAQRLPPFRASGYAPEHHSGFGACMEKRGYGDHDFDFSSRLLLCGDIELNPGPDTEEIMQTLLQMEKKYDAGQTEIKVMQGKILGRPLYES